jgi:hypothetical protein
VESLEDIPVNSVEDLPIAFEQLKDKKVTLKDTLSQQQQASQEVLNTIPTTEGPTAEEARPSTPSPPAAEPPSLARPQRSTGEVPFG